jgi:hypothetical protein
MLRLWSSALEDLLPRLARKVLVDPAQQVDLMLFNAADGRPPDPGPPSSARPGSEK